MGTQVYQAHILVVDDSSDIQEFLKRLVLEPAGYQVTLAQNGEDGFRLALEQSPDMILLDYEMPRMNGVEVLRALAAQKVYIPTILITSYGSESVAVDVFRLGVRDYIPKPFTVDEILEAIQRVLYTVRLEQERDALFAQLQQTNTQLAQHIKELDILYHVSKSVTTLQEREKLLERILDAALYLTGAADGRLALLDQETGNVASQVLRENKGAGCVATGTLSALDTQTMDLMMNVPLQLGNKTVGVLTVSNKRNRWPLNPQNKRMLRMLADYAAIAIENFRLLAEIETRQDREKRDLRDRFSHYLAPSVVERILKQPLSVRPGGHRRPIAVLFADLRNFSVFSRNASPETIIAILNRHVAVAIDAIRDEGGTLDKFMGDEVMALFNAPTTQSHYTLHAVSAAWQIQQRLQQVHQLLPVQQRLLYGIGIATGDAIVGNVGTDAMVNYTAVGVTVGKAHLLQELAAPGGILICHSTYEIVKHAVRVKPLPPLTVKGQQHPEPVYEVLDVLVETFPKSGEEETKNV
ncbi:MAG: response regulator [Anaerolineae bacterium]|nr:response regulator [Anaerolineae bacterium]